MNVSGVGSVPLTADLYATVGVSPTVGGFSGTSQDSTVVNTDSSQTTEAATVNISRDGQLFSKLQSLAQSDPAKFKEVTADIAKKLKDAAGQEQGKGSDFLSSLAARFQQASDSGDASVLKPSGK